jgi:hypothetical protein
MNRAALGLWDSRQTGEAKVNGHPHESSLARDLTVPPPPEARGDLAGVYQHATGIYIQSLALGTSQSASD